MLTTDTTCKERNLFPPKLFQPQPSHEHPSSFFRLRRTILLFDIMQLRISTEVPMMSNHMSKPSLSSCLEQSITSPVEFDAGCLDIEQMIKGPAPEIDADLCIDSDFAIVPDLPVISDFTSIPEIDVKVNSNAMSLETLSNAGSVAMSVDSGCETSALSVDMNLTPSETSSPYDREETLSPSCSEYSDSSSSSLPMDLFLRKVTMSDDAITLAQHGYSYLTDICPTLQGTQVMSGWSPSMIGIISLHIYCD